MARCNGLQLKRHRVAINHQHQGYQAAYTRYRAFRAYIAKGRFQCLVLVLHRFFSIPWYIPIYERSLKLRIDSLIKQAYYIPNPC
jgi:hypothetical protein